MTLKTEREVIERTLRENVADISKDIQWEWELCGMSLPSIHWQLSSSCKL